MERATISRQQQTQRAFLGGYDPTEERTAQADGMSRELCGDIFDV